MERDVRQKRIFEWVESTFGHAASVPRERALRLLEEAVELAQAEGLSIGHVQGVVDHVFSKPPGAPEQEAGGVGVTLLAYCASKRISADEEEARETARVLAIDPSYFRARHNKKADAGIAVRAPEDEGDPT
jgi:hypothetical protein